MKPAFSLLFPINCRIHSMSHNGLSTEEFDWQSLRRQVAGTWWYSLFPVFSQDATPSLIIRLRWLRPGRKDHIEIPIQTIDSFRVQTGFKAQAMFNKNLFSDKSFMDKREPIAKKPDSVFPIQFENIFVKFFRSQLHKGVTNLPTKN